MPAKKIIFTVEERVKILIEDKDFNGAHNTIERFLDENPTCSIAYLYKILIDYKMTSFDDLKEHGSPLDNNPNYKRALEFAETENEKKEIEAINLYITDRINVAKKRRIYNEAISCLNKHQYAWAIEKFESIKDYEDSASKIEECKVAWEERKKVVRYKNAVTIAGEAKNNKKGIKKLEKAIELLSVDPTYENSANLIKSFKERIEKVHIFKKKFRKISLITILSAILLTITIFVITFNIVPNSKYDKGMECLDKQKYTCAINEFDDLDDFKDSKKRKLLATALKNMHDYSGEKAIVKASKNTALDNGVKIIATYDTAEAGNGTIKKDIYVKTQDIYIPNWELKGYTYKGCTLVSYDYNPYKNVLVLNFKANFELNKYSITYDTVYEAATFVGEIVREYTVNDTVTLPRLEVEGYTFMGWKKGKGIGYTAMTTIQPGDYEENLNLVAEFGANTYFITTKYNNGGYVMNGSTAYYKTGEEVQMYVTPKTYYELSELYYQRTGDTSAPKVNIQGDTFIMPGYDVTVYGVFVEKQFNATVHIDPVHSLNINSKYKGNIDMEINVVLREGYHLTALYYTVGDSNVKHNINNGDVIKTPYDNMDIYVEAVPYTYNIYKNVVGSGSINVATLSDVDGEVELTYSPSEGYYLEELYYILDDTTEKVSIDNNKFIMPAGNVTIYAIFKAYQGVTLNVDGRALEFAVKEGTKLKNAFGERYDLNHTMGYYTDSLCREWYNPELEIIDGMVLYTKVATLDRLTFSEDNTKAYAISDDYTVDLVFPAYHNDVKIKSVNDFEDFKYSFTYKGIYLPYGITEIGSYAFAYTYLLRANAELYIPSTVKTIKDHAFQDYGDGDDDKLTFGGVVETVGYNAFYSLNSELSFDFEHVKYIDKWAFAYVNSLNEVNLSSVIEVGWFAFAYSSVVNVIVSGNPYMGAGAFSSCKSLKTLVAADLTVIDGGSFLAGCSSLTSAYLPKVTSLYNNMFNGCTSLEEFEIGQNVSSIDSKAFYLSGIKSLVIPTSVTRINIIAFDNCANLEYVILHNEIKDIWLFEELVNMTTTIYFEGDDLKLSTVSVSEGVDIKTYSESPIYDGNHWRYVDGVPTIYTQE